jgi:membrane protease YdiL (CAAX protease family)
VTKPDLSLIAVIFMPLLILSWIPPWEQDYLKEDSIKVILLFLLIPVVEEIIFRGILQTWLRTLTWFKLAKFEISLANITTSCLFSVFHIWQHPLFLFPGYLLVSLVLGYYREKYKGMWIPICLHSYFNVVLLLA